MHRRGVVGAGFGLGVAATAGAGYGQAWAHAVAESAQSDVALIGQLLKTMHPGVYRYQSEAELDAGLQTLQAAFAAGTQLPDRYLALSGFLARIRCGHSYANFYNQSDAVKRALFAQRSRLPFTFAWVPSTERQIGPELVVLADQTGQNLLARGSVVQRINGVAAHEVLQQLLPYTRVDGNNPGKQWSLLGVRGSASIEFFDIFHGMVFGEPSGGRHRLLVRDPSGQPSTVDVPAITGEERAALMPKTQADRDAVQWTWRMAQGAAILTMPSWALYNSRWNWKAWLKDRFAELAANSDARALIVDIRDCEGGLDCGDEILARFLPEPMRTDELRRAVRYRQIDPALSGVLDSWNPNFKTIGANATPFDSPPPNAGGGTAFELLELPSPSVRIEPKAPSLSSRIALRVLTSAHNSSATHTFVTRMRAAKLGLTVGQTTGGNRRGINASAFFFVRLPASGLSFDLPLIGFYPRSPQPDEGLTPDIAVAQSTQAIARGQDPELQAALASI